MNSNVYIHYGHKNFDIELFKKPTNQEYGRANKPHGGLWASPVDAAFGWREWNEREGLITCSEDRCFRFSLSEDATVYHMYCEEDVEALPLRPESKVPYILRPDFEKILEMGYDAIEYHLSQEIVPKDECLGLYFVLYGWDCDSILVLNPSVIIPIE